MMLLYILLYFPSAKTYAANNIVIVTTLQERYTLTLVVGYSNIYFGYMVAIKSKEVNRINCVMRSLADGTLSRDNSKQRSLGVANLLILGNVCVNPQRCYLWEFRKFVTTQSEFKVMWRCVLTLNVISAHSTMDETRLMA
jgi:hypothetical protein